MEAPVEWKPVTIEPLDKGHWEKVKQIYESGIATGIATFETQAPTWEKWTLAHLKFGRLVAIQDKKVVGWAALSPVSDRCVYGGVAEVSVYVDPLFKGQGIGKRLLRSLIAESEENGIWTLQASIFSENEPSLRLHQGVGFRVIGYRERIGKLWGEWKDNILLERRSSTTGT